MNRRRKKLNIIIYYLLYYIIYIIMLRDAWLTLTFHHVSLRSFNGRTTGAYTLHFDALLTMEKQATKWKLAQMAKMQPETVAPVPLLRIATTQRQQAGQIEEPCLLSELNRG